MQPVRPCESVESSETPAENRATTSFKSSYLAACQVNGASIRLSLHEPGEIELGDEGAGETLCLGGAYVDEILSLLRGGCRGGDGGWLSRFHAHLHTTRGAEEEEEETMRR